MPDPLLAVHELTKRYAVTVLDHASLDILAGEVHALLGTNGAGKSTLCRMIAGLVSSTSGRMTLGGEPFAPSGKQSAEAAGVQIVQQELNLISTLTVAENLMLGRMPQRLGIVDQRRLHQTARVALDRFGLASIDTHTITGSLGVGHQQMVEIASALDRECRLLILDEPTASLSAGETETLFQRIDQLREQGIGIIYISHRLDEVSRMADRVTVLRDGKVICTRSTAELSTDEMVGLMTGESVETQEQHIFHSYATSNVALTVNQISRGRVVQDVSFELFQGERLGFAGLVGAGRTELLRLLFGADQGGSGSITLAGQKRSRRFSHPSQAVAAGLAMVTEDRKENGLLLSQSVRVNTTLRTLRSRFSNGGLIHHADERSAVEDMCQQLETRCTSIEQTVSTLSGGNQQKVAVAKWLLGDSQVFFFDEPTRGIDVAARQRIYRLFTALAADGKALLIVSSDLDELMETCDRIAVMSAGRLIEIFTRGDWSEDRIMQAAFAGHVESTP